MKIYNDINATKLPKTGFQKAVKPTLALDNSQQILSCPTPTIIKFPPVCLRI